MANIKKELKRDSHSTWSKIKHKAYRAGAYIFIAFTTLGHPNLAQANEKNDDTINPDVIENIQFPKREVDYQVDTLAQYNPTIAYFMKNKQSVTQNYYEYMDHNIIQELSTLAHEQKHRDNSKFDLANTPMSLTQQYKSLCHNEISANIVELLQLRQMYIEAKTEQERNDVIDVMSINFKFYADALKSTGEDKIDPFSTSPKDFDNEMSFIANTIQSNWINKKAFSYNKTNVLVVQGTFSVHNYDTLQENDANYQKYLDHAYTIGGLNFSKYMKSDIPCCNPRIVDAQKLIEQNAPRNKVEEEITGKKYSKTVLDKNYTPETYTAYTGNPIYPKWSKNKRVSDIQTAEIFDFSSNALKQYRDYLVVQQASNKHKKYDLKFNKRTQQRAKISKKKVNISNNTYVVTPDML